MMLRWRKYSHFWLWRHADMLIWSSWMNFCFRASTTSFCLRMKSVMNGVLNKYLPERSSHSRLQVSNSPIFRSLQPIKQLYCESKYLLLLSEKNQFWSTNRVGRLLFDKTQSHNNMDFIILHIWSL